ncbi:hypothetical protein NE237_020184 [Protea cynaroides]|uniref:Uncharacterized protein n=1 Tax=Protea cynaroides TaxID=273540 RepID=A0A9Q0K1E7_9MAGN|nr:hypothetical protein NE237_020184 [Protea cynaroides]
MADEDPIEYELFEGLEPLDPSLPWDYPNDPKATEASKEEVVSSMIEEPSRPPPEQQLPTPPPPPPPSPPVVVQELDASGSRSSRKKPREPKWPYWLPPDWHIHTKTRKSGQVDKESVEMDERIRSDVDVEIRDALLDFVEMGMKDTPSSIEGQFGRAKKKIVRARARPGMIRSMGLAQ